MAESELQKQGNPTPDEGKTARQEADRQGVFKNVVAAFKHINEASLPKTVKQRISDYFTIGLVLACILGLLLAVFLPASPAFKLLPIIFTIGAVVAYMINRMGIIISLTSRQALIVWQIVIASFWLGVTSSMMVMMSCYYLFSLKKEPF